LTASHGGYDHRELGQHEVGSFRLEESRKIAGTRIDWVGLEIKRMSGDAGSTNLYMVEPDEILESRSCMRIDEKLG
jgi:hypothetical protein